jgi:hypothetical protein
MAFDNFLGMLGLRSTGEVLKEKGIHLRLNFSKYAGYPTAGISLYSVPGDVFKDNILPKVDAEIVEDNLIPEFGAIRYPLRVYISKNHHNRDEMGFLIHSRSQFKLYLQPGIRSYQISFFGFGHKVEIKTASRDEEEINIKELIIPRISQRPFYYESKKEIDFIEISSVGVLIIDLQFFKLGWKSIPEIQRITSLYLPSNQNEIDERVSGLGIDPGKIPIESFDLIMSLINEADPAVSPVFQFKLMDQDDTSNGEKAKYKANHHEILSSQSIHPAIARAAGLYYIHKVDHKSQACFLAGAHWDSLKKDPDGYSLYRVKNLYDTDTLNPPTELKGYAINGELKTLTTSNDKSGVVGIGLKWKLPFRITENEQNHAVRYLIKRTNLKNGKTKLKDIITGENVNENQFQHPHFQFVDFGENELNNGLDGKFKYEVKGVSLFGVESNGIETDPIKVNSFTIPSSPVNLLSKYDPNEPNKLQLDFSWTSNQYNKDSDVVSFQIYIDYRQLTPIKGEITDVASFGNSVNIQILPSRTIWNDGVNMVGGLVNVANLNYVIEDVTQTDPLKLKLPKLTEMQLSSGMSCVFSPNWSDPSIWSTILGTIKYKPTPEDVVITAIEDVPHHPDMREITLNVEPFISAVNDFFSSLFDAEVQLSGATILQDGFEFNLWPLPDASQPLYNQKFRVGVNIEEDENSEGVIVKTEHYPTIGEAKIFPKIIVRIINFDLSSICSDLGDRKRFALGVSAIDSPQDGSNEGPVSTRVFIEWISPTPPQKSNYIAEPEMTSLEAERAGADGFSHYDLIWDQIVGASNYHIYRTDENMLVASDRDRRVEEGLDPINYETMSLYRLWQLASIPGNQIAFSRLTEIPWKPKFNEDGHVVFRDKTLPGHSLNRFFYRIQGISSTNVVGEFSDPFQPVHCPLARKPEKLKISRFKILTQENVSAYLFWPNNPSLIIDYYILYRTENEDVANKRNWNKFEHAVKIPLDQFQRPLMIEFGFLDLSGVQGGKTCTPLGIFKVADYNEEFGETKVDFATANGALQNFLSFDADNIPESILGRIKTVNLEDNELVMCYYEIDDVEKYLKEIAGEKMYIDQSLNPGIYYYFLSSVDKNHNISDLSEAIKIDLT